MNALPSLLLLGAIVALAVIGVVDAIRKAKP